MTLTVQNPKEIKNGNDSTTVFSFTFVLNQSSDLVVTHTNAAGVETTVTVGTGTTNYSISLPTTPGNGSITYPATLGTVLATGATLTLQRIVDLDQDTDLVNQGAWNPSQVEDALDYSRMINLQQQGELDRSIKIPVSDSAGTSLELPTNTLRANKAVVFSSTGNVGVSVDNYVDQATASAASAATASAAATAAQSAASAVAVPFLMDTGSTTMADPAGTNFRLNHGTMSSVNKIAFGDTSKDGVDVTDYLMTWDDSTSTINGHLILVQEGTPANWAVFTVGAMTDNTDWVQCAVTYVDSGGSLFTNDITVRCQFIRNGDKGDTGLTGAGAGLEMTFESTATDTDQGAGKIWLNHGTASSATVLYMDDVDANAVNINSLVDSWDDSTNLDLRGTIIVKKQLAPENYHIYNVTGVVTSASTYSKIAVTHVVSAGTISDTHAVDVQFVRSGDKGATGARGSDAGLDMTFESTTTDTDQGVGKVWFNHGTLSSASVLYMDDVDRNSASINSWVDSWDDSTTTALRGTIKVVQQASPAIFAIYNVTGAVTSATTYSKIPVSYITGAGSFTDADVSSVSFFRTGNTGSPGSSTPADNVFRIQDNSDATKQIAFQASTVGSGVTRTITMPNADVTLVASALANVVEDTSPQLGANLDLQAFNLTSSSTIMNPSISSTGKALVLGF